MRERNVQAEIALALGSRPDVRVWRQQAGRVQDARTGHWLQLAPAGAADLCGIWKRPCPTCGTPAGVSLQVEVKSPNGRQRPEQANWARMIRTLGGVYVLAHSTEEALACLKSPSSNPSPSNPSPSENGSP